MDVWMMATSHCTHRRVWTVAGGGRIDRPRRRRWRTAAIREHGQPVRRRARPHTAGATRRVRQRIGSALAAIVALFAKFFAAIKGVLLLLPKLKLLATAGTALVSVAAYSLFWGWEFAAGFVVLLFVHEMGHVIQLRREGIKASAPMFVPFLGAVISAQVAGRERAGRGARGPRRARSSGTIGRSRAAWSIGEATNSDLLPRAGLHRLLAQPLQPAAGGAARRRAGDGGDGAVDVVRRASARWSPWRSSHRNPILLIICCSAASRSGGAGSCAAPGSLEQAAYYRVPPRNRLIVGAVYIGLIVLLAVGMSHRRTSCTPAGTASARSRSPLSAALRARPVPCRAWSRARGWSGACRRGPCRGRARSRPWRAARRSRCGWAPASARARPRARRARSSSRRCSSSLRGRSGSWLSREAGP